jgi:HTH-type transcriptional regulator/antitoxin HigA
MRKTKKTSVAATDTYFELVKAYPLRSLKSRAEHRSAVEVLSRLAIQGVDDEGSLQYMDTLAQLIDDYERDNGMKRDVSHVTPVMVLRHIMEERGLTVSMLGKIVGSQGTLSDVLAGRRQLSKAMIRKLADHFGVSPAVFL